MKPTAEKILSLLIKLYAEQEGVKITYKIIEKESEDVLQDRRSDSRPLQV